MKKLFLVAFWTALSFSGFAYQAQFGIGAFGDVRLEAVGKFKFSDFALIDLAPTNAPKASAS